MPRPLSPEIELITELLAEGSALVLSGAGLSTDSGIPDYRGATGSLQRATPMTYRQFVHDGELRRRYWARSHLGWRRIIEARPNSGHVSIAALEHAGLLRGTITQNVDGLHQAAGSSEVIELHGNLARVICLDCGDLSSREELDQRLRGVNPTWEGRGATSNADGDAEVVGAAIDGFSVVGCQLCGGVIKPDVVFFGESVPKPRVAACFELLAEANSLLVIGSSLTVMSGFRFVLRARELDIPVLIVNQGPTRGDEIAGVRIDAPIGEVLPTVAMALSQSLVS
jgi:NAD-dependent SIR2 family protein deacetylase